MMKFVAIVGSNADISTNRTLLKFMQNHFADQADIEICEIMDLPAFNEPEDRKAPDAVSILAKKVQESDGVIISTPEYDHSIPAALKSALEWLSYSYRPFIDKPVMITGCSHGVLGSSRAQAHLRQILDSPELKARIMPSSEFLVGHSLQAFDASGSLIDQAKVAELEDCFAEFLVFVQMTKELLRQHPNTKAHRQFSWKEGE